MTVELRLSRAKVHKAPGPDGVPNWILRNFLVLYLQFFHATTGEGFIPLRRKESIVTPVPKIL